ncbi:hypothetical protein COLO4_03071 [Corchorus olitorius]|uniref:Uncharacterized protein n=1 Tax=Corchorus olitorius TaxID=93759 RepID=A0A1R3KZQ3_9ROSI|nr:hypothetical protein COLO4_03071 [Corchorus olitorius]
MLRNESGEWVTEQSSLQDLVLHFFRDLYTADASVGGSLAPLEKPKISDADGRIMGRDITSNEVHDALFQMKPPGVDGFQTGFYQVCWSTVGNDLVNLVQSAFRLGSLM